MARGEQARQYESVEGDHSTKLIAFNVQRILDDYKKQNDKWPVSLSVLLVIMLF